MGRPGRRRVPGIMKYAHMAFREDTFLRSINRQEPQAYRTLYTDYYRSLVMYCRQFVPRQDVAEDIVQELFVNMWNKQMVFLSYPSFKTYLYTAVRNASLDYLKHQDVKQRHAEQWAAIRHEEAADGPMFDEEVYRRIYQAVDQLAPKCREVFLLAMEGKRNEEIAEQLHIAIETVKTQKKRAIRQLRERTALPLGIILLLTGGW